MERVERGVEREERRGATGRWNRAEREMFNTEQKMKKKRKKRGRGRKRKQNEDPSLTRQSMPFFILAQA